MQKTVLLNHTQNTAVVEREEKERFLLTVLFDMEMDLEDVWDGELPLSADCRMKMRQLLTQQQMQVIDDHDGHMQIFYKDEKIAEWFKSSFKLKRDASGLDPRKQLYIEMTINYWSMLEEYAKEED